jgi:hypothetical protein
MRRNYYYPSPANIWPAASWVESHSQLGPHWQLVPHLQAQPTRAWQPQVQASPGQSRHWQVLFSSSFMAISLDTGG